LQSSYNTTFCRIHYWISNHQKFWQGKSVCIN
jgi:hypothetical protein